MCSNSVIFGPRVRSGSRPWAGGRARFWHVVGRGLRSSVRHASAKCLHRSGKWSSRDPNMLPSFVFRGMQDALTTLVTSGGHSVIYGVTRKRNACNIVRLSAGTGSRLAPSANMAPIRRYRACFPAQMTRFGPDSALRTAKPRGPAHKIVVIWLTATRRSCGFSGCVKHTADLLRHFSASVVICA
jgi:hypothetical protein